ncbi:hypothetical protein Tco_1081573 [Tanacetum coccineum]|uniref:Uncharacterized protein n=1 Tax=Tanacetum coccineum TaxID=301880 RepID=A0ABQ5HXZ0_9ASTR
MHPTSPRQHCLQPPTPHPKPLLPATNTLSYNESIFTTPLWLQLLLSSVFLCRDKNQVCLLCEVILKQIPAFNFFCASLESIIAIENTWEWEEVWGDTPTLHLGFVLGGKNGVWGGVIPPKKTRGKGKKAIVSPKPASVEFSDESDSEPARKLTGVRKSMSLTEAAEEKAARQVHATHERIVTKSNPEPARRRPSGIAFRDTSGVSKKMSPDPSQKLNYVQTLTPEEQLVADTMQALKASRKSSRSQPHAGGSSEGTGTKPGVPDESTVTPKTSDEGIESEYFEEENVDEAIDWVYFDEDEEKKDGDDDNDDDDDDDDKSIDIEETDDEETNDEFVRGDEQVQENVDEEMKDAEVDDIGNSDEEITNTTKADAEKIEEVKDDNKKAELPPLRSNLYVSLGFGNQFLNHSFDKSTVGTLKDSVDAEINSLLDVQIQQEIPQIQSPSILTIPILMIFEPVVLSTILEIPTVTSATTPPHYVSTISPILQQTTTLIPTPTITAEILPVTTIPDPLPSISKKESILEKDVQELKAVDHTTTLLTSLRSKIPSSINAYLGSSLGDALQKSQCKQTLLMRSRIYCQSFYQRQYLQSNINKALEKTPTELAQSSSQAQSSLKAAESLSEYELKMILFDNMDKRCSYLTHDKHQDLYDALFNSLSLDDAIVRGQANPDKILKKRDRDDKDHSAGPNQGKKTKRSRTKESEPSKKSSTTKESSKGTSPAKTSKSGKSVTVEEPVKEAVFEMATDHIEQTVDDVVNDADQPPDDTTQTKDKAPKYNLFKQPPRTPTPDPEWNKCQVVDDQPEYKPLHLKGCLGRLTVPSEYFFNNDLEYLKSSYPEKKYTMSITKTKAARYELVGFEGMILNLWSATKVGYNKDVERGIKHWGPKGQMWYRSEINKFSNHNVYSTLKILSVVSVKINKLHGYGHLEEIVVKRVGRQKYTFKEGDFVNLHLNDIEDMLLLVAQHKLFNLKGNEIFDLADYSRISAKELYPPLFDPHGAVYEDLNKRKRVMRADELNKFSDGTLKLVHDELHHRIVNFRLGYNIEMSRRKWSAIDKRRPELMVELIDKQMRERRIIRNLERLVGARELEMDYMLMHRTI